MLVGIGQYPEKSGWPSLSAENDINLMRSTLLEFDFENSSISSLQNECATKEKILQSIDDELINESKPGDLVVFHFSGHGQQTMDINGDEVDHLDEALVPFDSPKKYNPGIYEGENLIIDDELHKILNRLRRKLGPGGQLLVIIDACHSGTSTRAYRTVRGTNEIMAPEEYINQLDRTVNDAREFINFSKKQDSEMAPMVSFFSAAPNQNSFEIVDKLANSYGILTYSFCSAMQDLSEEATYRELMNKIRYEMSTFTHLQNPMAEGFLDRQVFGQTIKPIPKYYEIKEKISDKMVLINAGELHGFYPNSEVTLIPKNSSKKTDFIPKINGSVDEASAFDADVILNESLDRFEIKDFWIQLNKKNFGDLSLKVNLDLSDFMIIKEMTDLIDQHSYLAKTELEADIYLENPVGLAGSDQLFMYQSDDQLLWKGQIDIHDMDYLKNELSMAFFRCLRAKYLRALDLPFPTGEAFSIQLLVKDGTGNYIATPDNLLQINDTIKLEISNLGSKGFYFTLLDIQPDNRINNIFPGKESPFDFYLPPGKSYTSTFEIKVMEPPGTEILKLIATDKPIEYKLGMRSAQMSENPLADFLDFVQRKNPLSVRSSTSIPIHTGYTESLVFEIE